MEIFEKNQKFTNAFKKNSLGWKLIVGLILWIFLTFFLHFRQVRVEIPELNSTAPSYIVAQVDFSFPDDEATIILKQKKLAEINPIYFINAKEVKQKIIYLEQYLIDHQKWKDLPYISYEIINDAAELFEKILMKSRFTDAKTLNKLKKIQY